MKRSLLAIFVCFSLQVTAQHLLSTNERTTAIALHLKYESDDPSKLIVYHGFVVNYNAEKKAPNWVIEAISPEQLDKSRGKAKRSNSFRPDGSVINPNLQATEDDYHNSSFDKGHFAPAADFAWNQEWKDETFYFTNIAPQTPDFNQGIWERLESKIRDLVQDSSVNCYVITGAIYASKRSRGLSSSKIGIPSAFYKIVYFQKNKHDYLNCFLIPHQFYYASYDFSQYQVTLNELEQLSQTDFFDKWLPNKQTTLEGKLNALFIK